MSSPASPSLFIRPNEFTQPDYTVIYRADDDRQINVGLAPLRINNRELTLPK